MRKNNVFKCISYVFYTGKMHFEIGRIEQYLVIYYLRPAECFTENLILFSVVRKASDVKRLKKV